MKRIILSTLILLALAMIIYCSFLNKTNQLSAATLSPIDIIPLKIPEPSGLHFESKTNSLWIVSDENSTIYNVNLKGQIISKMIVDGKDLEGITLIKDSVLVVVLERDRSLVFLDKIGKELNRINLELSGDLNKGIEGIAFNPNNNSFFVVNEKKPGLLLEIDSVGKTISKNELTFASDYSGLFFDQSENILWIISDEDKAIFRCTTSGKLISKYNIEIEQIEGISINFEKSLIYIISDPLEKLFVFELP
ncbi:MAG: SdiA-regulated domain-containing protein [Melioribacteraceae bacterium]|nr:SdiA-regulated domain-containing protein [Melioribacteraceae bacterium]